MVRRSRRHNIMHISQVGVEDAPMPRDGEPTTHGDEDAPMLRDGDTQSLRFGHAQALGDDGVPSNNGEGNLCSHDTNNEPKPSLPTAEDIHDYLQQKPDSFHSANSRKNQKHQQNREVSLSGMILNLVMKEASFVYQCLLVANLFRLALDKDASIRGKSLHQYLEWRCWNDFKSHCKNLDKVLMGALAMPYHVSFREKMMKVVGKDLLVIMLGNKSNDHFTVSSSSIERLKKRERVLVQFCKRLIGGYIGPSRKRITGIFQHCPDLVSFIDELARDGTLSTQQSLETTGIPKIRQLIEINSPLVTEFIHGGEHVEESSENSAIASRVKARRNNHSFLALLSEEEVAASSIEEVQAPTEEEEADDPTVSGPQGRAVVKQIVHDEFHQFKLSRKRQKQSKEKNHKRLVQVRNTNQKSQAFSLELQLRYLEKRAARVKKETLSQKAVAEDSELKDIPFSVDETMDKEEMIQHYFAEHPDPRLMKLKATEFKEVRTRLVSDRKMKDTRLFGNSDSDEFTPKSFCVEVPWHAYRNDNTHQPLPYEELKLGIVKRFVVVKLTKLCFYVAKGLKDNYHYLADDDEAQNLMKKAVDSDVSVSILSPGRTGLVDDDPTIRIMASGQECFDVIFSDVKLDVEEIVNRMLDLADDGLIERDPLRGTIAIDIGFGAQHQSKDHESQEHHSPALVGHKLLIEKESPAKKAKKKRTIYDQTFFYLCLQDLLPRANRATLLLGVFDGVTLFPDHRRRLLFGRKFADMCGCNRQNENNFEAVTFSLTNSHSEGQQCSLERHKDALDDGRDGYNVTSVLSLDGIFMRGGRFRLSIIFYLRNHVGSFIDKEFGEKANTYALEIVQRYKEESTEHQPSYDAFVLDQEQCIDLPIQKDSSAKFCGIKVDLAFLERDGYHSTIAYPILQMRRAYKLTRKQVTELVYLGMLACDAVKFSYILIKGFLNEEDGDGTTLSAKDGVSFADDDSMSWRYVSVALDLNVRPIGGLNARAQPFAGSFFREFENMLNSESLNEYLEAVAIQENNFQVSKLYDTIMSAANNELEYVEIINELRSVKHIGGFSVIGMLAVAAMVGLLTGQKGYENAAKATFNPNGEYTKRLCKLGCINIEKQQKLLKFVSETMEITPSTVESALCEGIRDHAKSDTFYYRQFIMKLDRDEDDGWAVLKKDPGCSKWVRMSFAEYSFGDREE